MIGPKHPKPTARDEAELCCDAAGCDRAARSMRGGYCDMHRQRVAKYGTAELPAKPSAADRFWTRTARGSARDCWPWTGALDVNGYGRLNRGGRGQGHFYAHRLSYEINIGPIPAGLTIDHLCRNKRCVNPNHLEPVTNSENIRRAKRHRTHCIHGHVFSEENTYWRKEGRRQCITCARERKRIA